MTGVQTCALPIFALALDEDAENVKLTLAFLRRHGLIEICDDDEYQLTEVPSIIGTETASAMRVRAHRERKKQYVTEGRLLQCNTAEMDCNNLKQICSVEIEIDKELEKEGEKGTPTHTAYGKFCNVFLSDAELEGLKSELPDKWEYYIDHLSAYIASSGRKYHNHAATIYKWAQEDIGKAAPKKGIPDYSYSEEDSL